MRADRKAMGRIFINLPLSYAHAAHHIMAVPQGIWILHFLLAKDTAVNPKEKGFRKNKVGKDGEVMECHSCGS